MRRLAQRVMSDDLGLGPVPQETTALLASRRISVLVGSAAIPLFPGLPVRDSERSPWSGLLLETHRHGPVAIPEHEHATFCLQLQTSGPVDMVWHSSGKSGRITSTAGNLILLTPGTRDSVLWLGASDRIVASIHPYLLRNAAHDLGLREASDFDNHWSLQDEQLRLLLTEMNREMDDGWTMGPLYGDLLSMSLSMALIKKYGGTSTVPALLKGGLSRAHLNRVLDYIHENLDRDLRLPELSGLTGLSMFHFARSFRESLGLTPHQYVINTRVESAKSMLMRAEWNIEQIASATGFSDGSQLSKVFRKIAGVSPSQWRRMR